MKKEKEIEELKSIDEEIERLFNKQEQNFIKILDNLKDEIILNDIYTADEIVRIINEAKEEINNHTSQVGETGHQTVKSENLKDDNPANTEPEDISKNTQIFNLNSGSENKKEKIE